MCVSLISSAYNRNLPKEFCKTCLALGQKSDFIPEQDTYDEYKHWCVNRGGKPVGFPNFWSTFGDVWKKEKDSHAIYYTKRVQKMQVAWGKKPSSKRATGWAGIRFADPADEVVEEEDVPVSLPVPAARVAPALKASAPAASVTSVEDATDVDQLLDELKEGNGFANATWAEYQRQWPVMEAERDAEKAEQRVVELKREMEQKVEKAEQQAKELAERAELERKKVASSELV